MTMILISTLFVPVLLGTGLLMATFGDNTAIC